MAQDRLSRRQKTKMAVALGVGVTILLGGVAMWHRSRSRRSSDSKKSSKSKRRKKKSPRAAGSSSSSSPSKKASSPSISRATSQHSAKLKAPPSKPSSEDVGSMTPPQLVRQASLKLKEEGNQLFKQKDLPKAIEKYSEAIKLTPDNPHLYGNRALAYTNLNKNVDAFADAERMIQLDSENAKGYHLRGLAFFNMGQYAQAKDDFEKTLELKSANEKARERLQKCKEILAKNQQDKDKLHVPRMASSLNTIVAALNEPTSEEESGAEKKEPEQASSSDDSKLAAEPSEDLVSSSISDAPVIVDAPAAQSDTDSEPSEPTEEVVSQSFSSEPSDPTLAPGSSSTLAEKASNSDSVEEKSHSVSESENSTSSAEAAQTGIKDNPVDLASSSISDAPVMVEPPAATDSSVSPLSPPSEPSAESEHSDTSENEEDSQEVQEENADAIDFADIESSDSEEEEEERYKQLEEEEDVPEVLKAVPEQVSDDVSEEESDPLEMSEPVAVSSGSSSASRMSPHAPEFVPSWTSE